MTKEDLIEQAKRISNKVGDSPYGSLLQAKEFLKTYAGEDNQFYISISGHDDRTDTNFLRQKIRSVMISFIEYASNDLLSGISIQREIQIDTVSDYLEQAEVLLNNKNVHPGAPAIIIGASLEEFLRNWLEDKHIDLSNIKNTLDSYAKELRTKELIDKQDLKDITSWGGIRNDAAHGHWDNVNNRQRIKLMLEGVNLFMRKYSE